jgi:hypothetical protein
VRDKRWFVALFGRAAIFPTAKITTRRSEDPQTRLFGEKIVKTPVEIDCVLALGVRA